MARFLIVDGHSAIFAMPDLNELHRESQATAREELVRRLAIFQDAGGTRVVVVFDGQGNKTQSFGKKESDIQVVYSARNKTADSVIERLVGRYSAQHDLLVATNDRAEREVVHGFGGTTISIAQLVEERDLLIQKLRKKFPRRNS